VERESVCEIERERERRRLGFIRKEREEAVE